MCFCRPNHSPLPCLPQKSSELCALLFSPKCMQPKRHLVPATCKAAQVSIACRIALASDDRIVAHSHTGKRLCLHVQQRKISHCIEVDRNDIKSQSIGGDNVSNDNNNDITSMTTAKGCTDSTTGHTTHTHSHCLRGSQSSFPSAGMSYFSMRLVLVVGL